MSEIAIPIHHGQGAYAWLSDKEKRTFYFLPLPLEDCEKAERVVGTPFQELVSGMLGIVSGGVDAGEPPFRTIQREYGEERNSYLPLEVISNGLPKITVGQQRKGRQVSFDVVGHNVVLDSQRLAELQNQTPVVAVGIDGVERFLEENQTKLRPFVYRIGIELLQSGRIYRL